MDDTEAVQRRRIRVWFGGHLIADYRAQQELADRYAAAMTRRFAGLRVTTEPLPAPDDGQPSTQPSGPVLPSNEGLWPLTVL